MNGEGIRFCRLKEHCRLAREQRERTDADRPYRPPGGVQDRQENRQASEVAAGKISIGAYSREKET